MLPARRGSSTTWLDWSESDPGKRYKTVYSKGHLRPLTLYSSPDGIHWKQEVENSPPAADRTTVFWNPFRKVWVVSLRDHTAGTITVVDGRGRKAPGDSARFRSYREAPDLAAALNWKPADVLPWVGADRLDPSRVELNVRPELYNLDVAAYESVLVGLFSVWRGQPDARGKPNDIVLGYSRDGFHWDRPSRRPFLPVSERKDDWNWANVQSAGGGFLVVGDRLFFYVSGRKGANGEIRGTGLATLRRDGFASMDAGDAGGTLTTRPVRFRGSHLFVNVDSVSGALAVELLDSRGHVILPFSKANSVPMHLDSTLEEVRWKGGSDLSSVAGTVVRVRFHLRSGRLYSFWVSPDPSGASGGYVAAGGPGFTGPVDTAGSAIYQHCCAAATNH
ncbi:MAG: glycosyl hydrolase family 32, partial [Acidobacteria bacterium]|nr:glycosyl hydrolase family 32 [Acidobacteriota bacterium]